VPQSPPAALKVSVQLPMEWVSRKKRDEQTLRAHSAKPQAEPALETAPEIRERRKRRVAEVAAQTLAGLPRHIAQLDALLSATPVDLKQVTNVIRIDTEICELLLSLASTELFNPEPSNLAVSESVVLLGSTRLRALALSCSYMRSAGARLPNDDRRNLWQHSFLTAALSERTARQVAYSEAGQAYLGGLLHDIGHLPLLIVAREEEAAGYTLPAEWQDIPAVERDCFGVSHCTIGRSIASAWNLPGALIDAIEHHDVPAHAKNDPALAEIVAAGDRYSNLLAPFPSPGRLQATGPVDALLRMCVPSLWGEDATGLDNSVWPEDFDGADLGRFVH